MTSLVGQCLAVEGAAEYAPDTGRAKRWNAATTRLHQRQLRDAAATLRRLAAEQAEKTERQG